ncbi:hypothetical protein TeGR_g13568, partial [Tetraparma gracilis]
MKDHIATMLSVLDAVGSEVPIVGQLITLANRAKECIDRMDATNETLAELTRAIARVEPTVRRYGGVTVDDDIRCKLENLKQLVMEICNHATKWSGKAMLKKMWNTNSYREKFESDRLLMVACLDSLSRAVEVDTNLGVKGLRLAQEDVRKLAEENNQIAATISEQVKALAAQMGAAPGNGQVSQEIMDALLGASEQQAAMRGEMNAKFDGAAARQAEMSGKLDALGNRSQDVLDQLLDASERQDAAGREQAAMSGKLDDGSKERAEMNGKLDDLIASDRGQDVLDKLNDASEIQAATAKKQEEIRREQAEINAKLDGLAASHEKQSRRQRAKSDRNAALGDAEIPEADITLEPEASLGVGGFGAVHLGRYYNKSVAVKVMDTKGLTMALGKKLEGDFTNEVSIMKNLTHPNIIRIWGCCTTVTNKLGSVHTVLVEFGDKLPPSWKLGVFDEAAHGMAYLYSRNPPVQHQDFKPANLLVMDDWGVKITDFGLSKSDITLSSTTMTNAGGANGGTLAYMAPEVHDEEPFTEKCDVYSYGVSLWEIWTGKVPFEGLKLGQLIKKVCYEKKRPSTDGLDVGMKKLVEKCWAHDPDERPNFEEIKEELRTLVPDHIEKPDGSGGARPKKDHGDEGELEHALKMQLEEERRAAQREKREKEELEAKLARLEMNSGNPTLNKNSSSTENESVDEKWERLLDDTEAEGNSIPVGDTLVMAVVEGVFLDGDDACNKKVLLGLMDIRNTGAVTKLEFKKFCSRWKKTGLDFAAYLEQETEKKRKEEEEAARKAQEEAAEAKRVADEERRQAEADAAAEKEREEERGKKLEEMGGEVALVDAAENGDAKM